MNAALQCRATLDSVVAQADAAVVEEPGEGRPALEHVIHRLGNLGMAGQPGAARRASILPARRPAGNAGLAHGETLRR
jgi:hypothetical protein